MNLVPDKPGVAPNYWCTWNAQHPMWYIKTEAELREFNYYKATENGTSARSNINQKFLFEDPGWAENYWKEIRSDLYLCLDDGWDVPFNIDAVDERWRFGSLELNQERFPCFSGTPAQRLGAINRHVKDIGWRGVGLWVAAQCFGDGRNGKELDEEACREYWSTRARWCTEAGIEYWKVDWGYRAYSTSFRELLNEIVKQEAPNLIVEHAYCMAPLNNIEGDGRFAHWKKAYEPSLDILEISDVFRTYDEISPLNVATTLDRIASLGGASLEGSSYEHLLNCEDNVYLGAALGCSLGIMRVPVRNEWTNWKWPGIDEVVRSVRWQRIAPPFGLSHSTIRCSNSRLTDNAIVREDHWYRKAAGVDVEQSAPALVSRGMPLPEVTSEGLAPFVLSSRNPNGATSIAVLPRSINGELKTPIADIEIDIAKISAPIGVFGKCNSLSLKLPYKPVFSNIYAQDLLGNSAIDITQSVEVFENTLVFGGDLLEKVGLSCGTKDDSSDPGLVLQIQR